ncbi:MAG: 50S ribosomal protein L13 [Leptospiraceae bacterium]|nr:50S ribosomal protein L13 [Leptospiraceae bacterium]MCB1316682.1 50S ribosomal protein L13 [Leptospiraceae bacterium]
MGSYLPQQRTKFTSNEKIEKKWILVDAENETLGRLASRIAHRLRGKHRPDYAPHQDIGDYVVVVNAARIIVSGKKADQKIYYKHTGYPGGMKTANFRTKIDTDPIFPLRMAVRRMLPAGPLGRKLLGHLKVFPGEEHDHKAQKPVLWQPTYK